MSALRESESSVLDAVLDRLSADQQNRLASVLECCLVALEQGESPHRATLLDPHPDLAELLDESLWRAYVDSLRAIQDMQARLANEAPLMDWAPDELGDFEILGEIGRGGMGVVYDAMQKSLRRRVALKVLPRASLLDSRQVARFRNEAHAAAQLQHPHVVPVYQVGFDQGVHFYAMQYIEGCALDELIEALAVDDEHRTVTDDGPPAIARLRRLRVEDWPAFVQAVADLARQAGEALHAAHVEGMVHRDIKPSNLLLDHDGRLWVTDFGLARLPIDDGLTQTGDVIGTVRYMSPEQRSGATGVVDHRSDVYSLGATLFELLTLRPLVEDPTERSNRETPDSGYRALQWSDRLHPIPRPLRTIVETAVAHRSDDRYGSAQAFAEDLQAFARGAPISVRPPSAPERAFRWLRRRRGALAAAAVATATLATIGVLWIASLVVANQQTELALQDAKREAADAQRSFALLQSLHGEPALAEDALRQAISLRREVAASKRADVYDDPLQLAEELSNCAMIVAQDPRRLTEALEMLTDSRNIAERVWTARRALDRHAQDAASLAVTVSNLGSLRLRNGETDQAIVAFRQSLELLNEAARRDASLSLFSDRAVAWNNLGRAYYGVDQPEAAGKAFRSALAEFEKLQKSRPWSPEETVSLAGVHHNLGRLAEAQSDKDSAVQHYQQAIDLQLQATRRAPDHALWRRWLARYRSSRARVENTTSRRRNSPKSLPRLDASTLLP